MARVPLAGTDYIPGQTEERALAELKRLLERQLENPIDYLTADAGLLCEIGRDRGVLEETYPQMRFLWLDTEESTGEVFWLDAAQFA